MSAPFEPLPFEMKWAPVSVAIHILLVYTLRPEAVNVDTSWSLFSLILSTADLFLIAIIAAVPVTLLLTRAYYEVFG